MSQGKEKKKEASLTRLFKSGSGFPPDRFVLDTFVSVDIHSSTEFIYCGRLCVESLPDYFSIMALGFSESWRNDRPHFDWLAPSLTHGGRKAESKGSFHKRCLLALFMSPGELLSVVGTCIYLPADLHCEACLTVVYLVGGAWRAMPWREVTSPDLALSSRASTFISRSLFPSEVFIYRCPGDPLSFLSSLWHIRLSVSSLCFSRSLLQKYLHKNSPDSELRIFKGINFHLSQSYCLFAEW